MFCHEGRRKCHVLPWSAALPSAPFPSCRNASSASRMSFLHRVSFPFVPFSPPPARPASGTLFRAYRGRARARVRTGAVRAPDCPRARGAEGPLRRDVMRCHVLSWSAVSRPSLPPPGAPSSPLPPAGRRKRASVSFGPALPALSAAPSRDPARRVMKCHVPSCLLSRCIPSSHFVPSPSSPPFFARFARARARVRAGAVRTPDCAHEAADARLLSIPSGFFSRRRETKGSGIRIPLPHGLL